MSILIGYSNYISNFIHYFHYEIFFLFLNLFIVIVIATRHQLVARQVNSKSYHIEFV